MCSKSAERAGVIGVRILFFSQHKLSRTKRQTRLDSLARQKQTTFQDETVGAFCVDAFYAYVPVSREPDVPAGEEVPARFPGHIQAR